MISGVIVCLCLFASASSILFDPYQDVSHHTRGSNEVSTTDVLFVIRSQPAPPHVQRSRSVKEDIQQQCRILDLDQPTVVLLHEKYHSVGQWTILPVFPKLHAEYGDKKWIFFCEEDTRVSVRGLLVLLSRFNPVEEWFLGKGLFDQEATIIHHFRFHDSLSEFIFPDFDAGWLLSKALFAGLASRWKTEDQKMDFSIDVKHEVAYFIWNEENGLHMTGLPQLCAGNIDRNEKALSDEAILQRIAQRRKDGEKAGSICVSSHPKALPECGAPVSGNDILFAVKTCEKYHKERVPVVKKTWGGHTDHIVYFSNKEDQSIPTVDCGVPNTERGHCGKTFAIFEQFIKNPRYNKFPWLVVTDDDTILSVSRLRRLLSCYDATTPVILGERYGYGHIRGSGYNYITGGGGMVFSRVAVTKLLSKGCQCNKIEDPDDMIIGMCAKRFDIPLAHSPLFHQARPVDYAKGLLAHQAPVSFHKHWQVNPIQVYEDWFQEDDVHMRNSSHDEL